MTESIVLSAESLEYRYAGGHHAVRGVNLTVRRGEVYALLGSNGAGKTTTLEVLEGFRTPSAGNVDVLGGDPRDRRRVRPHMGIMLQEAGFAVDQTVAETVALAGRLSGRDDEVSSVLDAVELGHRAGTRVAQLSGGEKRRLDFACAAWGAPELLVLDEPTTGLDPEARDRLWKTAMRLRDAGTTILLTTHYLEEAERYADRIGFMSGGQIVREGTLEEITAQATASIRFRVPDGATPPLAINHTVNGVAVVSSTDLQADLYRLLSWAHTEGLRLEQLHAAGAGLSELFSDLPTLNQKDASR